jgi:hypothetical protein
MWGRIHGWFSAAESHKVYARIPHERTDVAVEQPPLVPYGSYFRVWLSEMFLTDRVAWGRQVFPAVHAEIHLEYGGRSEVISRIAQPSGPGVWSNQELLGLMPYNGGTVEIEAALLGLPGADYLQQAVGVLASFSNLVVPPFGQVLDVAGKVATGIRDLVGGTQGQVHLGFHETLISAGGGGAVMRPGYLALVLATQQQLDETRLCVAGDRLLHTRRPGERPQALREFDYMLVRIEGRSERDDWRLKGIQEPLSQALAALARIPPDVPGAQAYQNAALATALQSPDLAELDRRRVVDAIKAEISDVQARGLGAVGDEMRDLNAIMAARAISRERSAALGRLTSAEVFGSPRERGAM